MRKLNSAHASHYTVYNLIFSHLYKKEKLSRYDMQALRGKGVTSTHS